MQFKESPPVGCSGLVRRSRKVMMILCLGLVGLLGLGVTQVVQVDPNGNTTAIGQVQRASASASTAALALTLNPGRTIEVLAVRVTVASGITTSENLTATLDSSLGATWDWQFVNEDLSLVGNHWGVTFDPPIIVYGTDEIDFTYLNTDDIATGLEVLYRNIGEAQ